MPPAPAVAELEVLTETNQPRTGVSQKVLAKRFAKKDRCRSALFNLFFIGGLGVVGLAIYSQFVEWWVYYPSPPPPHPPSFSG